MGVKIGWLVPDQVYYMVVEGDLSADEYHSAFAYVADMANNSSFGRVHGVVDSAAMTSMPPIRVLTNVPRSDKVEWTLLVGVQSPLVSFAATVVHHTLGLRVKTVPSLDEALEAARKIDPAIDPSIANRDVDWLYESNTA